LRAVTIKSHGQPHIPSDGIQRMSIILAENSDVAKRLSESEVVQNDIQISEVFKAFRGSEEWKQFNKNKLSEEKFDDDEMRVAIKTRCDVRKIWNQFLEGKSVGEQKAIGLALDSLNDVFMPRFDDFGTLYKTHKSLQKKFDPFVEKLYKDAVKQDENEEVLRLKLLIDLQKYVKEDEDKKAARRLKLYNRYFKINTKTGEGFMEKPGLYKQDPRVDAKKRVRMIIPDMYDRGDYFTFNPSNQKAWTTISKNWERSVASLLRRERMRVLPAFYKTDKYKAWWQDAGHQKKCMTTLTTHHDQIQEASNRVHQTLLERVRKNGEEAKARKRGQVHVPFDDIVRIPALYNMLRNHGHNTESEINFAFIEEFPAFQNIVTLNPDPSAGATNPTVATKMEQMWDKFIRQTKPDGSARESYLNLGVTRAGDSRKKLNEGHEEKWDGGAQKWMPSWKTALDVTRFMTKDACLKDDFYESQAYKDWVAGPGRAAIATHPQWRVQAKMEYEDKYDGQFAAAMDYGYDGYADYDGYDQAFDRGDGVYVDGASGYIDNGYQYGESYPMVAGPNGDAMAMQSALIVAVFGVLICVMIAAAMCAGIGCLVAGFVVGKGQKVGKRVVEVDGRESEQEDRRDDRV